MKYYIYPQCIYFNRRVASTSTWPSNITNLKASSTNCATLVSLWDKKSAQNPTWVDMCFTRSLECSTLRVAAVCPKHPAIPPEVNGVWSVCFWGSKYRTSGGGHGCLGMDDILWMCAFHMSHFCESVQGLTMQPIMGRLIESLLGHFWGSLLRVVEGHQK